MTSTPTSPITSATPIASSATTRTSQIWYEAALKADPNHVRTWSYYGMWQMEQGNRLKALDDLQKVNLICGNTSCEEYRQLKAVIDGKASY